MAQKVLVVCDLDANHEEAETVSFGYDSRFYEADLCELDASRLQEALEPFIDIAREVSAREAARRALNGPTGDYDPAQVRSWALANGIRISDRGRVSEEIVSRWRAATQS